MKQKNLLKLIFAVVVVLIVGMYVYLTGSAPVAQDTESQPDFAELNRGEALVVQGQVYGVCDQTDTCTAFTITDTGEYSYVSTPQSGDSETLRTGSLPTEITSQLIQSVTAAALEEMSKPIDRDICDSQTNSVDARYVVELDGEVYELDSCTTNVEADAAAWEVLGGVWYWFELSEGE